jgi:hypothetical protein
MFSDLRFVTFSQIVARSTSLEGHLARCHYNDKHTKLVKAGKAKFEVRQRASLRA